MTRGLAILAAVLLLVALSWGRTMSVDLPEGMPVETLAATRDQPQPKLRLTRPLPAWIPLPDTGYVVTAGLYPPQPPYGAAATLTLKTDLTAETFAAAYRSRLEQAGFAVRGVPAGFNIAFDAPDLQLEAIETSAGPLGAHVIYVALRHTRAGQFAQITGWEPPAPQL